MATNDAGTANESGHKPVHDSAGASAAATAITLYIPATPTAAEPSHKPAIGDTTAARDLARPRVPLPDAY